MVAPGNDKTISVNELGLGLVPSEPGLDVIAYRHARSESPHVAVRKQRLVNTTIRTSRQRETYPEGRRSCMPSEAAAIAGPHQLLCALLTAAYPPAASLNLKQPPAKRQVLSELERGWRAGKDSSSEHLRGMVGARERKFSTFPGAAIR